MKPLIIFLGIFPCSILIAKPIESYRAPKKIYIGSQNCYSSSIKLYHVLKSYLPTILINDTDCLLDDGSIEIKKIEPGEIPNSFARDWVPLFIENDDQIQLAFHKQVPSKNVLSNFTEPLIANARLPFAGGNLQVDGDGRCLIAYPAYALELPDYQEIVKKYKNIGCTEVVRLEPAFAERTQHVDIFLQVIDNKKVLLADYSANVNKKANEIMNQNLSILTQHGFEVHRVRQPGTININNSSVHISYINSLLVDKTIFLPIYGLNSDADAIEDLQRAGLKAVPVKQDFPWFFGSIHCLTAVSY